MNVNERCVTTTSCPVAKSCFSIIWSFESYALRMSLVVSFFFWWYYYAIENEHLRNQRRRQLVSNADDVKGRTKTCRDTLHFDQIDGW